MNRVLVVFVLAALAGLGQEVKFPASFEKLAAKAVETVDVTLDGSLLQLAGKFLSADKPDEARVKQLLAGLKGIYVRSFEFDKPGEYSAADVEAIRAQLRAPAWQRIVGVTGRREGDNAEVFVKPEGNRLGGIVVLAADPKELTVVNIVGVIDDLDKLAELGGHLGVPSISLPKKDKGKD